MRYFAVICTAFVLAFLAGLPDKSMFASLILSTRYRPSWVWAGAAAAGGAELVELPHAAIIKAAAARPAGASHLLYIASPHSCRSQVP